MNDQMHTPALIELNRRILRFFLPESRQIGDLIRSEDMRPYSRRLIRTALYSLATSNLLETWGSTSGKTYRTSHLGWIVLQYLEPKRFDNKRTDKGSSALHL